MIQEWLALGACAFSEDYGHKDALMSGMKGLALFVFTIELLSAQTQPTLPGAIQNPFRFGTPGPLVAAGFDGAGNLYLAGQGADPTQYPSTATFLGPTPTFYVMKISGASTSSPQVVYVTGIGPGGFAAMAVDPAGNVYLAGSNNEGVFPTTPGSFQPSSAGYGGFLLKLDPSGKKLVYSTTLDQGGTYIYALAIDGNGNAYVGGQTSGVTFPTTAGAYQSTPAPRQPPGYSVGFVSEFDPTGAKLLYSTLIGEGFSEVSVDVLQIAVDSTGAIHIGGEFVADGVTTNFPSTANAAYSSGPGFFAILSEANPNLLYSTPLPFVPYQLGIDAAGDTYLASDGGRLLKISHAGTIGYYAPEVTGIFGTPLLVLSDGTAVVAGSTESASYPTRNTLLPCGPNLPRTPAAGATYSNSSFYTNATLTTLDPSGNITFSTLLGGLGGNAFLAALALDPNGALYAIGSTGVGPASLGTTGDAQFPGGPIIDSSSGIEYAFKLDFSAVPQGLPAPSCLASGGNFNGAPVAAGAITTLFGSNLGPTIGVQYQLDANGLVPTTLDATTITVGGVPAPILYAQDTQVNFVVPQQISSPTTDVCITRSGVQSCIFSFTAQQWPAIFCVSSCNSGGSFAVLNQDGTLNSSSNPAAAGTVLQIYGTGMGLYDRSIPDGSIVQPPLANLARPVFATFSGPNNAPPSFPGSVLFAGAAPLEVVGVDQVNVLVPNAAVAGAATLTLQIIGIVSASANVWLK
jgi:uncharacterized protein (TIGR03437 family)